MFLDTTSQIAYLAKCDRSYYARRQELRGLEPDVGVKLVVLEAVRERGLSKVAFARLIDRDEKEARRILDPKHPTKLATLADAVRRLGKRLVIGVQEEHVLA